MKLLTPVCILCALLVVSLVKAGEPLPITQGDISVKIEPGISVPLTDPQSSLFELGGSETVKALWAFDENLDFGPSVTFLALPADGADGDFGTAGLFGVGVRYKRSHSKPDGDRFWAVSPWVDADTHLVRTGPLNRFGLALAVGVAAPIGKSRALWLGPFVRYNQIMQLAKVGFETSDAKVFTVGVSLEVGSGVAREEQVPETITHETIVRTVYCPDRDGDGIRDNLDRCPDVAAQTGCPPYEKVIVKAEKLELKESVYFEWDSAKLEPASFAVLDDAVKALQDNKGFNVQIEGHASSDGGNDHNRALSTKRAEAVLDYLVAHGVARERLSSGGFSSSEPAGTNATALGRENNRRVEFDVNFIIVGSK